MLWWIVQNVAITTLLAGVVWVTCRIVKAGPVTRHALWLLVLLKMLTPPMVQWPWPAPVALSGDVHATGRESAAEKLDRFSAPPLETMRSDSIVPIDPPAGTSSERDEMSAAAATLAGPKVSFKKSTPRISYPQLFASLRQFALPALAIIWAIGAICFALLQLVRITRMLRRARGMSHARHVDPRLAVRIEAMSRMLRVRAPRLRIIGGIGSPLVFALFRPQLWWPAELGSQLSDDALCGLILHELAHVKRRDHWVAWLELLAGCLWWWNPLYWYVRFQLRENAELACDGWVVAKLPRGRRAYGEALLAVCECLVGRSTPLPALGVGTGGRQFLERRLTMILRERIGLRLHAAGLLFVGLLAMAALPAWSQKYEAQKPTVKEGQSTATATEVPSGFQKRAYISFFDVDGSRSMQALPNDAQQVLQQFNQEQQEARRAAEQKIAELRQQAMAKLKELQDQYARNGQLDEAVAIRDRIRQMQGNNVTTGTRSTTSGTGTSAGPSRIRVEGDPGNLVGYRGKVGQHFYFEVVGSANGGTVWGSGVYTDDSALATAAVHAGILKDGERGVVRVTLLAGQESYEGSTAHDVTSQSYGQWEGSYRIERANAGGSTSSSMTTDPGTLTSMRDRVGQQLVFRVTGATDGTIWGGADGVYTDDSPLATAAVHAGVLKPGETGVVHVHIVPGRDSYEGSEQNGVKSLPYGNFYGSYQIQKDLRRLRGRETTGSADELRRF